MKKKYVLKEWVKDALAIIGIVGAIVLCFILLDKIITDGIEECKNAGNCQTYCEKVLY